MICLWLDDVRPCPAWAIPHKHVPIHYTHWAKTAEEAISLLSSGEVGFISLDHDLSPPEHYEIVVAEGEKVKNSLVKVGEWTPEMWKAVSQSPTGYDVACWIEEAVRFGKIPMPRWACHSANPSGRERIIAAMQRAERYVREELPANEES